MIRYLALDLGTKRCGVSLSDRSNTLACPYKTISYSLNDYNYLFNELSAIIEKENVTDVVVGKPVNMDGTSGFASKRSDELVELLKTKNVNISFVDERLTSVFANKILESNGKNAKNSKPLVDTLSACLILETYLRRVQSEGK